MTASLMQEISKKYDISENIVEQAYKNLNNGVKFIAVSGKIGAGKDTIAPLVLNSYNIEEKFSVQESFAYALKKEIQDIIDIIRINPSTSPQEISQQMNILESDAELVLEWLKETVDDISLSSYSRTQNIRKALQYWGTEVRRNQDSDYWVKKCIQSSYQKIAEGKSVYITDVRFPNEADSVKYTYGKVIRLDVSPDVQEQRIASRDGLTVSEEARKHPSETSLDDYESFDIRIRTDYLSPQEITRNIVKELEHPYTIQ